MSDAIVLNEISLPFQSVQSCEEEIHNFFEILHEIKNNNIHLSRVDNQEGKWSQLNYADGFSFDKWINSITDIDRQRLIKSVISTLKCPLMDINSHKSKESIDNIFFTHDSCPDSEVLGLAYAYLNQSFCLSVASQPYWAESSIPIMKEWYEGNSPKKQVVSVDNISSIEHIRGFLNDVKSARQAQKTYLSSLKTQNNIDFPNLLFTDNFLRSVLSPSMLLVDLNRVIYVLNQLNRAIMISNNLLELCHNSSLTITNESVTTMSNRALVRQRHFKHPILGDCLFEPHIKNFENFKRMHIFIDYVGQKICIGYFGKHLKT